MRPTRGRLNLVHPVDDHCLELFERLMPQGLLLDRLRNPVESPPHDDPYLLLARAYRADPARLHLPPANAW